MVAKSLRVAAIQPICKPGPVADNLAHLETLIEQVAADGAELVLLPERFPEAYLFDETAWLAASPQGGKVETWLTEMARKHGLYLGGSYLQANGDDFFNTFILASPDKGILGRIGKDHPCSVEAYIFRPRPGAQTIDTPLGRIGVAICYDNTLRVVCDRLLDEGFDLLLMPICAPTPERGILYNEKTISAYHNSFKNGATLVAQQQGVPAIMANKAGSWDTPLPGWLPDIHSTFPGFSHIADSDGKELARLGAEEGVIVAEVKLDPARKHLHLVPGANRYRPWVMLAPSYYKTFAIFEFFGRRSYNKSKRCVELARRAVQEDARWETRRGRRERKRQQTVDHLADTAWAMFEAQGYETVTMEAIAEAADVAKGTLYKHFPVKEALLRHRFHRELATGLPAILAELAKLPSVEARLRRFFDLTADDALLQYLSPLGWEHINLTGDYLWRSSAKVGAGKFRPLQPLPKP